MEEKRNFTQPLQNNKSQQTLVISKSYWPQFHEKRHRLIEYIWKQDPSSFCIWKPGFNIKVKHNLKMEKKMFLENRFKKKAGASILISDKIDLKPN